MMQRIIALGPDGRIKIAFHEGVMNGARGETKWTGGRVGVLGELTLTRTECK